MTRYLPWTTNIEAQPQLASCRPLFLPHDICLHIEVSTRHAYPRTTEHSSDAMSQLDSDDWITWDRRHRADADCRDQASKAIYRAVLHEQKSFLGKWEKTPSRSPASRPLRIACVLKNHTIARLTERRFLEIER